MCKFLGAVVKFPKQTVASACPPVCPHGTTQLPVEDFHEILYLCIFRKSVEKIQVSLKSDRNNGYYT